MIVRDLIAHLSGMVREDEAVAGLRVIIAKDAEGNEFSPMPEHVEKRPCITWDAYEMRLSAWSGEISSPENDENGELERVIVLWPMH